MKVNKSRKYVGSLISIIGLSVILTGCGNHKHNVDPNPPAQEQQEIYTTPITVEVVEEKVEIPNIKSYNGNSITEALRSNGYDSSFEYRKKIATQMGIADYKGTESQNITILNMLKEYANYINETTVSNNTVQNSTTQNNTQPQIVWSNWVYYDATYDYRVSSEGKTEFKAHNYGEYKDNGNGTETKKCETCGATITRDIVHNHTYGPWYNHDENTEKRYCTSCDETEIRNHTYGEPTVRQTTGTHEYDLEIKTYQCTTCSHQKVEKTRIYKNQTTVTPTPTPQTHTDHKYVETKQYITNSSDTHIVKTIQRCECGKTIEMNETKNCNFSDWYFNSTTERYEKKCNDCGHIMYYTNEVSKANEGPVLRLTKQS